MRCYPVLVLAFLAAVSHCDSPRHHVPHHAVPSSSSSETSSSSGTALEGAVLAVSRVAEPFYTRFLRSGFAGTALPLNATNQ